ncbi:MAG: DTW domain-containing protein [Fibrobacterota bacterium]|nr:DTW domain-containing protein [Fibrobacterota bacterium]QQS07210.1 MAG: DTW domain-containing protein [Fibrobacterota bacterium]
MRRVDPTNLSHRCAICGVFLTDCTCADLPRFSPRHEVVFLQHTAELAKPTNTARLACRILSNARCLTWNRVEPPKLEPDAILIYPLAGAPTLDPSDLENPRQIVLPDATWTQAARIANVLRSRGMQVATLPDDVRSRWGVREGGGATRVSSAEAAAFVLGLAGESEASSCLADAVAEIGRKIMAMRGLSRTA